MNPTAGGFAVTGRNVFDIASREVQQVHLIKRIVWSPFGLKNHQRCVAIKISFASSFALKGNLPNTRDEIRFNGGTFGVHFGIFGHLCRRWFNFGETQDRQQRGQCK